MTQNHLAAGLALAKDVFLGFVELHPTAAGKVEQILLGESVEWGVALQEVGHALSNYGGLHRSSIAVWMRS